MIDFRRLPILNLRLRRKPAIDFHRETDVHGETDNQNHPEMFTGKLIGITISHTPRLSLNLCYL
jgi:hypothetical protein